MDVIRKFSKWISKRANIRDEEAHDLSTWDPPLARSSIVARFFIILITIASYAGTYYFIYKSRLYLSSTGDSHPLNFNHAIAALVTLQLISASATIYKEDGVISESALVCLAAAGPILIASWSYEQMMTKHNSSR